VTCCRTTKRVPSCGSVEEDRPLRKPLLLPKSNYRQELSSCQEFTKTYEKVNNPFVIHDLTRTKMYTEHKMLTVFATLHPKAHRSEYFTSRDSLFQGCSSIITLHTFCPGLNRLLTAGFKGPCHLVITGLLPMFDSDKKSMYPRYGEKGTGTKWKSYSILPGWDY
jgi:hypothetical protein